MCGHGLLCYEDDFPCSFFFHQARSEEYLWMELRSIYGRTHYTVAECKSGTVHTTRRAVDFCEREVLRAFVIDELCLF